MDLIRNFLFLKKARERMFPNFFEMMTQTFVPK